MVENSFVTEGMAEMLPNLERVFCSWMGREEVVSLTGVLFWTKFNDMLSGCMSNKDGPTLKLAMSVPRSLPEDKKKKQMGPTLNHEVGEKSVLTLVEADSLFQIQKKSSSWKRKRKDVKTLTAIVVATKGPKGDTKSRLALQNS